MLYQIQEKKIIQSDENEWNVQSGIGGIFDRIENMVKKGEEKFEKKLELAKKEMKKIGMSEKDIQEIIQFKPERLKRIHLNIPLDWLS